MNHSLLANLLLGCALVLSACSSETEEAEHHQMDDAAGEHAAHASMDMETGEPSDGSLYHATGIWKNRNGEELQLEAFRGKVQVLAMAYTSCDYACPVIIGDMQEIREGLSEEIRSEVNFVLASIDPEHDKPERLKQFASENDLAEGQWSLLHSNEGDILELAALLGFRYQRISDTDFSHSNMITVLDKEGKIVHQRKQLSDQQAGIIEHITQAAQ